MSLQIDPERTIYIYTDDMETTGITQLDVLRSNAGYYIGRMCDEGPYCRNSGYFNTREQAEYALDTKAYNESEVK